MNTIKPIAISLIYLLSSFSYGQDYGTPTKNDIPEKLKGLKVDIEVMNFPKINDPIKIDDTYYWKHTTSILSRNSDIQIVEFGAYLFYNNTWNLRESYDLKYLDKYFGTKKQKLDQGQPYVWKDNWRVGKQLYGGWALWYFIGINANNEKVCGYSTIHTTENVLN